MANTDICFSSATELSERVSKREISPVEIVRAHLARIEEANETVNAFVFVNDKQALEDATTADADIRKGKALGPLHGIPVAYKDIYHVKGLPTTAGSKLLKGYVADKDSAVAASLRSNGAICLGKLNTWEFASGDMDLFGDARNPWNTHMITGGSSSGTGAALAAHLIPLATGSDTGGSVRNPAAYCGIVGLKPTTGLISCEGIVPLSWTLDTAGPMARTVSDAALMFYGMTGAGEAAWERFAAFRRNSSPSLTGIRIGVPRSYFSDHVDPDIAAAVKTAAGLFGTLGAGIEEIDLPHVQYGPAASFTIAYTEAFALHRKRFMKHFRDYTPGFISKITAAAFLTAQDHLTARQICRRVTRSFSDALTTVDAIVTPTRNAPAHPIGGISPESDAHSPTRPVSLTGLPALSVPCGFTSLGLPIGMQIIGRENEENTLLRIGHAYQMETEWHKKRAPVGPGDLWEPVPPNQPEDKQTNDRWVLDISRNLDLHYVDEPMAISIANHISPVKAVLNDARETIDRHMPGLPER